MGIVQVVNCKAVFDVKSRKDPCLSHHGRGSKSTLVLITLRVLPGRKRSEILS